MASSLFFDGDKRRIYEVPVAGASSFSVDANGYRIYTPDDPATAPQTITFTVFALWSRWVDYHNSNKWALLAFERSGGAYRYTDQLGNEVYALPDLRFINGWQYVPANYDHSTIIEGNLYPDINLNDEFDVSRVTANVSPRILLSDRGERSIISGATDAQILAQAVWAHIIEGALSAEEVQRIMLAALAGKTEGVGTSTEKFKSLDDTKPRITTTFDAQGNRANTTLDGS